eukprot:80874-Pelagomonas_calceolata.AAC.1
MVIAEDGVANLFCAQFRRLILIIVPEPLGSVSAWCIVGSRLPRGVSCNAYMSWLNHYPDLAK